MSTLDSSVVPPSVVHVVAAPKEDASDISTADTSGSEAEEREEINVQSWSVVGRKIFESLSAMDSDDDDFEVEPPIDVKNWSRRGSAVGSRIRQKLLDFDETAPPNELAMARFVFEQLGGRCKLVDKDFFVRCTDEEIAVAERLKAEKVRKMKQREERHQARSEEEWKKVQKFLEAHHFSAVNAAKISWWGLSRTYPLHVASKEGNFEVMLLLMKYGADPKQRDGRGKTAIAYTQLALRK